MEIIVESVEQWTMCLKLYLYLYKFRVSNRSGIGISIHPTVVHIIKPQLRKENQLIVSKSQICNIASKLNIISNTRNWYNFRTAACASVFILYLNGVTLKFPPWSKKPKEIAIFRNYPVSLLFFTVINLCCNISYMKSRVELKTILLYFGRVILFAK